MYKIHKWGGGKKFFSNLFYRIVVPSIVFSVIEYLPSSLINNRPIEISGFIYKTIGGQTYWFTSALVVAEIVILLLLITRRKSILFYALLSVVIGGFGICMAHNDFTIFGKNWWAYRQGLIAVLFLAMGGLYWRFEKLLHDCARWYVYLVLLSIMVILVLACDNTNPVISTLSIQPLGVITSLLACVLLIRFCKLLPVVNVFSFIGQNSIGFYFMSGALPIILSMIAHKLMPGQFVWMICIIWLMSLIIAYIVIMGINRWLPWLWDLRRIK